MLLQKISHIAARKISTLNYIAKNETYTPSWPLVDWKDIISRPEYYKKILKVRKSSKLCDIVDQILSLWNKRSQYETNDLERLLSSLAFQLPNNVHPDVQNYEEDFKLMRTYGTKKTYPFRPLDCSALLEGKDLLKMSNLNLMCGERSYYFIGDVVKLEQALIDYTVRKLLNKGFQLISVPDILPEMIVERSGMPTKGERTQIYRLDPEIHGPEWCLSGTSELAIAAFLKNKNFLPGELPKYYTAVSRCYRAEISKLAIEKGLYRVHQFTKVEMFGVCLPQQSENTLELFCKIQEDLFSSYDLHYRVIDMAPHELGHHAYRKYDIESWMPGMNKFGEISSCSNCIDYQSRRLNIRSNDQFVHTVNGTACAMPRMINTICETHQIEPGRVQIPAILQPLMGIDVLGMKRGPRMHKQIGYSNIKRNTRLIS